MKSSSAFICLVCCGCLLASALPARSAELVASPLSANDPVQIENVLIAKAHAAALKDASGDISSILATDSPFREPVAPSVLLARRTMAVCGWLQSDNEYGRAMLLAQRTLDRMAAMKESTDADREERLYWEALLEGWVLDQKARAIDSLEAARKLKPDDDRVVELEHELAAAVAEFGR